MSPTGVNHVPREMIDHVMSYVALDCPPPSDTRLCGRPAADMLDSDIKDLKAASLVCKQWRASVLPMLFRHVLWRVDYRDLLLAEHEHDPISRFPVTDFLRDYRLGRAVQSITVFVSDEVSERGGNLLSADARLRLRIDHDEIQLTYPGVANGNWIWQMLFDLTDALRLTLIAPPAILTTYFLSRALCLGHAWRFQMPFHILSLSRERGAQHAVPDESKQEKAPSELDQEDGPDEIPCYLFTIRPWTSLLLNEGSFLPAYTRYDFHDKCAPTAFDGLLGTGLFPNDVPLWPASIREMAYVGIFPPVSHMNRLLTHLPRIDKLYIQLLPIDGLLHDKGAMKNIDLEDLGLQHNTNYIVFLRELTSGPNFENWAHLREFRSSDSVDTEPWQRALSSFRRRGSQWRVVGDGIFVQRVPADPNGSSASESDGDIEPDDLF